MVTHVYMEGPFDRTIRVDLRDEDGLHADADVRAGGTGIRLWRVGGGWDLEWDTRGVLQAAEEVTDPFHDIADIGSPYPLPTDRPHGFHRVLRSFPVRVTERELDEVRR